MAFSSIELWQRIAAEGLASPMQCRSWAAEAAKSMPAADTADGIKVLQSLIELGKLTNYQAKILAGQSDRPLHKGPWTILRTVKRPLWTGWLEVTKVDLTKAQQPPASWVRWLKLDDLDALHSSAPSLPRGLQLASVRQPHLQSVFVPELVDGELQLQVAPLEGGLLADEFKSSRPPTSQVTLMVQQLAIALSGLHAANLVHGRVLPDRIYWSSEAGGTLACDPIAQLTATVDPTALGLLGERLPGLCSAQFLAPEFVAPGQMPTIASDVFALGCVWWWLLTGRPLVSGQSIQEILAAQTEASCELPEDCDYPEPLQRCLQHCLAKNLDARFANAMDVCAALEEARRVVAVGKIAKSRPPATPQPSSPQPASPQPASAVQAELVAEAEPPTTTPATDAAPASDTPTPARSSPAVPEAVRDPAAGAVGREDGNVPATHATAAMTVSPQPAEPLPATKQPASKQTNSKQPIPQQAAQAHRDQKQAGAKKPLQQKRAGSRQAAATIAAPVAAPAATRRVQRRRQKNKWLLPVVGGCGFLMLLLLVLKWSGALEPSGKTAADNSQARAPYVRPSAAPEVIPADPRLEFYQIADSGANQLWLPPVAPSPVKLDYLPSGGQMFVVANPARLMSSDASKHLLSLYDEQLGPWLQYVADKSGQPLESIRRFTAAFYTALASGGVPQVALRIELSQPVALSRLKAAWGNPESAKAGEQELLVTADDWAYYIAEQPLVDAQSVVTFSVGPAGLMREVAESQGASGLLTTQLEALRQRSDAEADLSILLSPRYLLSEGRGLLQPAPGRLQELLKQLLGNDPRAALLQTRLEPEWYSELMLLGASDRDAPVMMEGLRQRLERLPEAMEAWFVRESPHPYWRGLALRFPQMLRTFAEYTRFGVEDGIAVMNAYLPSQAAPNLTLASWIALQDTATLADGLAKAGQPTPPTTAPLTIEEYLARPIELKFDQEPMEVALMYVGEAANEDLPAGTPALKFILDGDAFENAGITRNQQFSQFDVSGWPVRDALTEIARRGNPDRSVTDLGEAKQALIWVVKDDPEVAGQAMISLTTRAAATAANIPLPKEFAASP